MKKIFYHSLIIAAAGVLSGISGFSLCASEAEIYVKTKTADIYEQADDGSEILAQAVFGEELTVLGSEEDQTTEDKKPTKETASQDRAAEETETEEDAAENPSEEDSPEDEWILVCYTDSEGNEIEGYIKSTNISEENMMVAINEFAVAASDGDIYDYPGRRDGEIIGELLEYDEVERIAEIGDSWSRIIYLDDDFEEAEGYILTSLLEGYEITPTPTITPTEAPEDQNDTSGEEEEEEEPEEAMLREGAGEGIFAEAEEGVAAQGIVDENGVLIGSPVGVSGDVYLQPLGTFRITHYCQCSICCGPYANGITATGVTAVTNHTIAVQPGQIPYGSKVVINGQVYVAEDCGGGIKTNCIDIYVASHAEALTKGVYYTDVYLLVNG